MPPDDPTQRLVVHHPIRRRRPNDPASAGTGTRTRMGLPPQDFKSRASTDFATEAWLFDFYWAKSQEIVKFALKVFSLSAEGNYTPSK